MSAVRSKRFKICSLLLLGLLLSPACSRADEIMFAEKRNYPKGAYDFGPYVLSGGSREIVIDRTDWKDETAVLRVDIFGLEEDGVTWALRGSVLAVGGPNKTLTDKRDGLPYQLVTSGRFESRPDAQIHIEFNVLNKPITISGVLK